MAQSKQNPNMALWESVQTTDTKYTKTANLDGRTVTSINGTYIAMRATEVFGPVGKGWGFDILVDRMDQGAPILNKEGAVIGHELMHTILLKFWYLRGGKKNYITQYGHTPFVRKSQYGPYTDFDAPKKSVTDAMKKCLSLAGFSADVHLGMFDDQTYLEGLELKKRLEDAGDPESAMDEVKEEFKTWLRSQLEALKRAPNPRALDLMRKQIAEKARAKALVVKFDPADIEARINEVAEEHRLNLAPTTPA
ncbi:hypothetical protein A7D27_10050 [Pseudomonas sp. 1D4]|uniref:hypothetical protein n=1 Tax=Pseudomonadaceae TaxID=135621 RepID=UPI00084B0CE1|nr:MULTISPECIES: hypothetical protein [Pseudomonas]MCO7556161.1 hypothetical protein [Pseudomonas otitidis]MCP1616991.1 hypothetical protein [Pseudomonas otitidis]OEC43151.1 hypothetical protein A7D27_10050 [Pseudomonas sp. 1D4]TQL06235.1 hypothetical protein FBY21_1589 [Pseudomonas sp. SLBN-26]